MSKHNIKLRKVWFPALFAEGRQQQALTRLQRLRRRRRQALGRAALGAVIVPGLMMASVIAAKPAGATYTDITASVARTPAKPAGIITKPTLAAAVAAPLHRPAPPVSRAATPPPVPAAPADPGAAAWAEVLNSYLAGSPMAGLGQVFYEAATANGLDPRLSVGIAKVESGLGRAIPGGYNAYGMTAGTAPGHGRIGNWQAFSSWEDAIWSNNNFIRAHWGAGAGPYNMRGYAASGTWAARVAGVMSAIAPPAQ